jgi:hypothetical protein
VETLPLEKLVKLNVRAGEHLAVILTTAFLGAAPPSRNVFLVMHPLDHMVLECIQHEVIGPLLDPMEGVSG